jgi:hypothetical protein
VRCASCTTPDKSSPYFSAVSVICLFNATVGRYRGEFSDIASHCCRWEESADLLP